MYEFDYEKTIESYLYDNQYKGEKMANSTKKSLKQANN